MVCQMVLHQDSDTLDTIVWHKMLDEDSDTLDSMVWQGSLTIGWTRIEN